MMNEHLNELRLEAGIARIEDDPWLVVINKEGNVIDPLIGLQLYGEAVVRDCLIEVQRYTLRNGDTEHNRALSKAMLAISKKFGVHEW
jgi:hypothetical protein